MLDEYWMYSLFTLVLLMIFEATVVKSRLRNLGTLRQMAQQPEYPVFVWRGQSWQRIASGGLLPGDVFSVARLPKPRREDGSVVDNAPDSVVPCDR